MTMAELLVAEFDRETKPTRRLLERVPTDKGHGSRTRNPFRWDILRSSWRPCPGWLTKVARGVDIDLAGGSGYNFQPTEALLEQFDVHAHEARAALAGFKDADYARPWSLKMDDEILFTDVRGMVIRQTINHFCHHRGQLTVYLRSIGRCADPVDLRADGG